MNQDNTTPAETTEAPTPEPETSPPEASASPADGEAPPGAPPPQWEYRTSFKIVGRLKEVVNLTMDVTQQEIARYRKKISKLTYGS